MRAGILFVAAALLSSCDTTEPPPGELIGGFNFVATLGSPEGGEDRCRFEGAPAQITFEGVLSFDPSDGKLWITTGNVRREGEISEAHFQVRSPKDGPGITRRLRACSCNLRIVEWIEGDLLTARSCLPEGVPPVGTTPQACPALLEDGGLDWSDCGCVRGELREELEFPAVAEASAGEGCICEIDGVEGPAPERCSYVYSLEGSLL